MSATNFGTQNQSWRQLMGNGLSYRVPRFQRDYSWGEEEWEDLWHDMLGAMTPEEPAHYMGYLVFQVQADARRFVVIGGQQRLATLAVVVLAGLRRLQRIAEGGADGEKTRRRAEQLRRNFIGYLDPVTLIPESKLTLNRNSDPYFQRYLVPLAPRLPRRGFKLTEHRLRKAFEWFERRLREHVDPADDPGREIARFIDRLSDRLFFTVITVTDELNAYRVFETLNARGVRLSATDLLKNYLFQVLDRDGPAEPELRALEERWASIVDRLGAATFPVFLRVHWISRHAFVRQSELFKTIRRKVRNSGAAFALLRHLEEDLDAYLTLTQRGVNAHPRTNEEHRYAARLRLFGVRQPLSLLLAAWRRFDRSEFASLLRAIVALSFRYNVIGGLHPGEQERVYSAEARRIETGDHATVAAILKGLRSIYPDDDAFRAAFVRKGFSIRQTRSHRIVRYILAELERHEFQTGLDIGDPALSVEHICPLSPVDGWRQFTDQDIAYRTGRLGNMVLLETSVNRKRAGNAEYEVKRAMYRDSRYGTTRRLVRDFAAWTPEAVEVRQRAMAKTATAVWRIPQLG